MHSRKSMMICALVLGFCISLYAAEQPAKPFLHPLFSNNMVLQREVETPVWGWTTPGSEVTVELDGKTAACKSDKDGKWLVRLPAHKAGGPFVLKVSGPETVSLQNVMIGDVWLCSGQSNMEMGVRPCENGDQEIASANYPNIRLFSVPKRTAFEPQELIATGNPSQSQWLVCGPDTLGMGGWGGFSAVGYFFGREIHNATKVPVGLIHSSWGGTIAEAWTSAEGLKTVDDFKESIENFLDQVNKMRLGETDIERDMAQWWSDNDPGTKAGWEKPGLDEAEWKPMDSQPQPWESAGLPDFDGVAWFRKTIDLPAEWADVTATIRLAMIDDVDTTFVNGIAVGKNDNWQAHRIYEIDKGVLKAGQNVIAVRVLDTGGAGGFHGSADTMSLAASGLETVSLAGIWQYRVAAPLGEMKQPPRKPDLHPNQTTVLYNGMIVPLLPYAIKGAIWYQGESNAGQPLVYRRLLPAMIKDWRNRFDVGEFPFLIVHLANFMDVQNTPIQDGWAPIRESQYIISRDVPNAGLASAIDIGDARDIHPRNKQEVGRRLALIARARTYGEKLEYSGPVFRSMRIRGKEIVLSFDHVDSGLTVKGEKLTGFAIAGEDRNFVYADAKIVGDTVVVSAEGIASPTVVYYGWANNPVCNLYNKEGLPAVPFRTDDK